MTATFPTYPYPPVQPPHPPVQPPRRNHTKMAVAVVAGLATLALFVLAIVGIHSKGAHSPQTTQPTTTQVDPMAPDVAGYLQALDNNGVKSAGGDDDLASLGFSVCANLRHGSTALQEVDAVQTQSPRLEREGATAVVDDSISFLCPDIHDSVPMPTQ
jgi:hypothetical protein